MPKEQESCFSDSESARDGPQGAIPGFDRFMWGKRAALKERRAKKKARVAKHSPLHRVMSQVLKAKRQKKAEAMRIELALASIPSHSSFESVDALSRSSSLKAGSTGHQRVPLKTAPQGASTFRRQLQAWSQQQTAGHGLVRQLKHLQL